MIVTITKSPQNIIRVDGGLYYKFVPIFDTKTIADCSQPPKDDHRENLRTRLYRYCQAYHIRCEPYYEDVTIAHGFNITDVMDESLRLDDSIRIHEREKNSEYYSNLKHVLRRRALVHINAYLTTHKNEKDVVVDQKYGIININGIHHYTHLRILISSILIGYIIIIYTT